MKLVIPINFIKKKDVVFHSGVKSVVGTPDKNLQLDWTKKEDARAAIRLAVKK